MKKFFGVIVAVMLCACLLVPTAFAADESADLDSILAQLEGADLGSLTEDDLSTILGDLGLSDLDIEGLVEQFEGEDSNEALDALNNIAEQMNTVDAENSGGTINNTTSSFDIAKIIELIPVDFDTKPIADMLSSLTDGGLASLMTSVGSIFSNSGVDLASEEVGEFDIATLSADGGATVGNAAAGSGDLASGLTNLTAGLADTLVGALETLGLDSSTIEGLLDNEIVNFFANMYIGFIGEVEESTTAAPTTTAPTTKPAVVTTTTPKTGDTSAVIVALSTLTVASAAAFVCLKKKKEA